MLLSFNKYDGNSIYPAVLISVFNFDSSGSEFYRNELPIIPTDIRKRALFTSHI